MKRIAIAAMCYTPSQTRVNRVRRVLSQFEQDGFAVKQFDSDGDYTCGQNAERAWEWASKNGQYACVIADDAEPCQYAGWAIDHLTHLRPNDVMTFMDWTQASETAREVGSHWIVGRGIYGPAALMPSKMVVEMMGWLKPRLLDGHWPESDDYTIGLWLKHGRSKPINVYIPVPCIFQHAEPSTSTLGQSNKNRVCRWMVDDTKQRVWDIDWRHGFDRPVRSSSFAYDPSWLKNTMSGKIQL